MSLTPASQVVLRQLDYFVDKNVIIAGELLDSLPCELVKSAKSVTVFTTNYIQYKTLSATPDLKCIFGAALEQEHNADILLIYWPKAKAEAEYLLAMLLPKLKQNIEVAFVGENRGGIKSCLKLFAAYGPLKKADSARRCGFYIGVCDKKVADFEIDAWFKVYPIKIAGVELNIYSLPGVFSHGELDLGTTLLLENLPELKGNVLDLGCGAGVIGAVVSKINPEITLTMTDISALALASTQKTITENKLKAKVLASNVYSDIDDKFHLILSNPPFHSGTKTCYLAAQTLIEKAPRYMKLKGQLQIVANSFLPYKDLLQESFRESVEIARTTKFKIIRSQGKV